MKHSLRLAGMAALGVFATASVSEAHTFGAYGAGFGEGLLHPFGGIDHVLAMMGVGLWASRMEGGSKWKAPAAFVAMMIAGGAAGMAGVSLLFAEMGIALSVFVVGAAIALSWTGRPAAGAALAGFFVVFHGYAHGAEISLSALPVLYAAGFVLGTSTLLGLGLGLGGLARRGGDCGMRWLRLSGGAIAGAALVLMAGL